LKKRRFYRRFFDARMLWLADSLAGGFEVFGLSASGAGLTSSCSSPAMVSRGGA